MEVIITITDIPKWERLGEKVIKYFLESSSESLTNEIKARTPVKTNNLRMAWKPRLTDKELRITNSAGYAPFVEKGTGIYGARRHRIFPKNKKVLHAVIDGKDVFFRHSRGQPGRHMAEKGAEAFKPRIPNLFLNAMKETGYFNNK